MKRAYKEKGLDISEMGQRKEELDQYINGLSVEQIDREIELLRERWEGFADAKREDGQDTSEVFRAIDALSEVEIKISK